MIISQDGFHTTMDGKRFTSPEEARQHNAERRGAIEAKIGRKLSADEWLLQRLKAADSRTIEEKMADENFTIQLNGQKTGIERERDRIATEIENERIHKLSPNERRLHDIDSKIAQDQATADAEEAHESRLKKYGRVIDRLKEMKEESAWDTEADERERILIDRQLEILQTPNSDLRQLRVNEVDQRQTEKRAGKLAKIEEQRHTLQKLLNDLPLERPLSTGGLPTLRIDRSEPLVEQAEDLVHGMFQVGYHQDQIQPVQDAIQSGEGLQELVNIYARPEAEAPTA